MTFCKSGLLCPHADPPSKAISRKTFTLRTMPLLLAMCPHAIRGHVAAGIFLLAISVNLHIARNGLDALQQLCPDLLVIAGIGKLVGANLVGPGVGSVGPYQEVFGGGKCFLGPVAVVDQPWRNEQENQDKGNHHVVVEAAPGVSP